MNCNEINTSNNNGSNNAVPIIKHVYGNVLRLAIPLTKRVITMENDEVVATDTDFIPSSDYPVTVQFVKDAIKIDFTATMQDGNVAVVEDYGTLPVGTFAIVVLCKDNAGNPYRFKQRTVVRIFDVTADADIQQPIEFESRVWYLDAAIFMALKGEDGVGIAETIIEESDEVGGYNYITFVMTDGTSRTFSVMNGSGTVDTIFSTTSQHPLANSVVTQRFNTIEQDITDAEGDIADLQENAVCGVELDASTNHLIGHHLDTENETEPLFSIDLSPYLKNDFIDDAFLQNGVLKLRYNASANKPDLSVNLNDHINPSDYFTKQEIIANYVANSELVGYLKLNSAGKINYAHLPFVILTSLNFQYNGNPTASLINNAYYCTDGFVRYFYSSGSSINSIYALPVSGVLYCLKSTGDLYRWDAPTRAFVLTNRHFDSQNYYTKSQVNGLLNDYVTDEAYSTDIAVIAEQIERLDGFAEKGEDGRLVCSQATAVVLEGFWGDSLPSSYGYIYNATTKRIGYAYQQNQSSHNIDLGEPDDKLIYYNKAQGKFFRYDSTDGMVEIVTGSGGSSGGGSVDLSDVFASVVYDNNTHRINFFGKGDTNHTTVLAYIDASPFIVDGMLSNVEVKNVTISNVSTPCMVFTFNTDSGKQDINVPVSSIFNAANYYTRTEIDNKGYLTQHQDISGKQDTLVSGTNIKTVNGESILGSGDLTVASVDATVVQTTGDSTTSVMSQKAVTDSIIDLSAEKIERGTSVQLPDDTLYTTLDATQVAAMNATDTVTVIFMLKGFEGGIGDQDNRYIELGSFGSGLLQFIGNVYGDIITQGETASQANNGICKILTNSIINPLVCALVCDRVKGTWALYCGKKKMGERTFANYQMEKFVGDSGVLVFDGGSQKAKCYGFQIYDFDATSVLGEFLDTAEKTEITQKAKSSYGADVSWVTQNTRNNQSSYTVATASSQYIYYNVANTGWLYKLTITVDVSFKITTMGTLPIYSKVYDTNGDKIYDQDIKGITFTAGTYKFILYGLSYISVETQADNATITVVESLKRRCGCIANFRFDTVYNDNLIYDDASGKFHAFYTNSACTTSADLLSSSTPARSVYTLGNLNKPHFVGEIKIYNNDVYIANDSWAWKKINNS